MTETYPLPEGNPNPPLWHAAVKMVKKELIQLLKRIDDCCESMDGYENDDVKLMLYFDEAHVLTQRNVPNDPYEKNMYDVLCSCLNSFLFFPVFAIFLSTTSNTKELAPARSVATSARAHESSNALQGPITETPFDCSSRFPIALGTLKLRDVSKVEFMAQFGRPM